MSISKQNLNENRSSHLISKAEELYKSGQFNEAVEICQSAYESDCYRTDVLLLFAATHYQLKNYDECIFYCKQSIEVDPTFAEGYNNLGNALKEQGKIDEAIKHYMFAAKLKPKFYETYNNLAICYVQISKIKEAIDTYKLALSLNPIYYEAHNNLGNVYKSEGDLDKAKACYLESIRINPDFGIAWSNLGALHSERGQLQTAISYYNEALRHNANQVETYNGLGNAYKIMRDWDKAIDCYETALKLDETYVPSHNNVGVCYFEKDNFKKAIKSYKKALLYDKKNPDIYNNLGNALRCDNKLDECIEAYQSCLEIEPDSYYAYSNMGIALSQKAIRLSPSFAMAHSNLASLFFEQSRVDESLAHFQEAIKTDPLYAEAYSNLGSAYRVLGKIKESLNCYETALKIKPSADIYANIASIHTIKGDYINAMSSYKQALSLKFDHFDSVANLHYILLSICDWTDWKKHQEELKIFVNKQLSLSPFLVPSIQPFHSLFYDLNLSELYEISKRYANKIHTNVLLNEHKYIHKPKPKFSRLKVGYISSDFNDCPISHLLMSFFLMQNQKKIEIFCYALSPSDESSYRNRIVNCLEATHFKDVSNLTNDEVAELVSKDGINILINLNGYTKGNRNEVFALRPSPIQIQFMGYSGTMGADYIDYIIADNEVIPPSAYPYYSEKVIAMPHSYFVNDYKQSMAYIAENQDNRQIEFPSRRDYGLPENKFIFCNFNQLHKIDPDIFKAWIRILNRVPNSILWLLRFPALGEDNIRKFAKENGLNENRLFFSDVVNREDHVKRCTLANLFLDTPMYNGRMSACEALWAGLPLITVCNDVEHTKMVSRISASLLKACHVHELICNSMSDYENLAVNLANTYENGNLKDKYKNNDNLNYHDIKRKLQQNRMTCPAFDTARWVKSYENALIAVWDLHEASSLPNHIQVNDSFDMQNISSKNLCK